MVTIIKKCVLQSRVFAGAVTLTFAVATAFPQAPALTPYQIKAGFIYNFAMATKWLAEDPNPNAPLVFGILGEDPSQGEFALLQGAKVGTNRTLAVKLCKDLTEAKECHMLFISGSEKSNMPTLLDEMKDLPVLTITDAEVGARSRGIIHFVQEKDKLRFEVSVAAAERAKLKISSQVLKVAKLRKDEPGGRKD